MDSSHPYDVLNAEQIERLAQAAESSHFAALKRDRMVDISHDEFNYLDSANTEQRREWLESKGKNRNKLCNCGSGKKFKRCCL